MKYLLFICICVLIVSAKRPKGKGKGSNSEERPRPPNRPMPMFPQRPTQQMGNASIKFHCSCDENNSTTVTNSTSQPQNVSTTPSMSSTMFTTGHPSNFSTTHSSNSSTTHSSMSSTTSETFTTEEPSTFNTEQTTETSPDMTTPDLTRKMPFRPTKPNKKPMNGRPNLENMLAELGFNCKCNTITVDGIINVPFPINNGPQQGHFFG